MDNKPDYKSTAAKIAEMSNNERTDLRVVKDTLARRDKQIEEVQNALNEIMAVCQSAPKGLAIERIATEAKKGLEILLS
jgi:hypothetical protein